METHDIIKNEQKFFKLIDRNLQRIFDNPNYIPLLNALRSEPRTIKEIAIEYNKHAKKRKSETTLYRYIQYLIELKLVQIAGQRVVYGKRATEILYSRTAQVFFIPDDLERKDEMVRVLSLSLETIGIKPPSNQELSDLLTQFEESSNDLVNKFAEIPIDNPLVDMFKDLDLALRQEVIVKLIILIWLEKSNLMKTIRK
ncbi:MAG: hypothetical protein ACFFB3_01985 [Candidatus Hodarchaeota archaeon]